MTMPSVCKVACGKEHCVADDDSTSPFLGLAWREGFPRNFRASIMCHVRHASSSPSTAISSSSRSGQYFHRSSVSNSCLACFVFCLLLNLEIRHAHCGGIVTAINASSTTASTNGGGNRSIPIVGAPGDQTTKDVYQPQNLVLKIPVHDHDGIQLKDTLDKNRRVRSASLDGSLRLTSAAPSNEERKEEARATLPDRRFYIKQLFKKYGDENVLTFEGFEHLLANLGLNDFNFGHKLEDHRDQSSFRSLHDDGHQHQRQSDLDALSIIGHDHSHDQSGHSHGHKDHGHDHSDHSHDLGDVSHSHDHGDHGHETGSHSHEHGDRKHEHGVHSHDLGDHSHDHVNHSHDHGDHSHDHGNHSHDHGDHSHDHGDRSHDQGDQGHDAEDHGHDHGRSNKQGEKNKTHTHEENGSSQDNSGHTHDHGKDGGHSHSHEGHSHDHDDLSHDHGGRSHDRDSQVHDHSFNANESSVVTSRKLLTSSEPSTSRVLSNQTDSLGINVKHTSHHHHHGHNHNHHGHSHGHSHVHPKRNDDKHQEGRKIRGLMPKHFRRKRSENLGGHVTEENDSGHQKNGDARGSPSPDVSGESGGNHDHGPSLNHVDHKLPNNDLIDSQLIPNPESIPKCLTATEILWTFDLGVNSSISTVDFMEICPSLILQITEPACRPGTIPRVSDSHPHAHDKHGHEHNSRILPKPVWDIPARVWGFSFLAVTLISLCGLLGVAIVPLMRRMFYNHLLQFLVALAVGTLTGDALLHLLPHAISSSGPGHQHAHSSLDDMHGDDDHYLAIWKGLTACMGIHFFFIIERVMGIFSQWRQKMNQRRSRAVSTSNLGHSSSLRNPAVVGAKLSDHQLDCHSCENIMMVVHPGKSLKQLATAEHHNESHCHSQTAQRDDDDPVCHSDDEELEACLSKDPRQNGKSVVLETSPLAKPAEVVLPSVLTDQQHSREKGDDEKSIGFKARESRERRSQLSERGGGGHSHHHHHHHGHGHGHHGHSHDVPGNVSSVAWMVIMGDGIHNFTDGMAIGAAFATSVTAGFSTSIAVFCHELPHELGDFAVLLKAGMSTKQALTYNVVSSVLCLFGMIAGILVGNVSNASYWVFCATAGLFLYISLVDMIPELTVMESKPGESPFLHLFIQNAGILSGFGIMLLIALYEHDIQTVFD